MVSEALRDQREWERSHMEKNKKRVQGFLCFSLIMELVTFVFLGIFLGQKLDSFIGGRGFGVLMSLALFFAIWIYHVMRVVRGWGKSL